MKNTDFRIGNLVKSYGSIIEINHIDQFCIKGKVLNPKDGFINTRLPYKMAEPIQLTEEWLNKFGFMYIERNELEKGYILNKKTPSEKIYIRTYCEPNISDFFTLFNHSECIENEINFIKKIHYVHELQNLYFSLTNDELAQAR